MCLTGVAQTQRASNHACLEILVHNHAYTSYLVLSSLRPWPYGCLPVMSLSHLALGFSSTCLSLCSNVPEPLLIYPFLLAEFKKSPPPLIQSLLLLNPDIPLSRSKLQGICSTTYLHPFIPLYLLPRWGIIKLQLQ